MLPIFAGAILIALVYAIAAVSPLAAILLASGILTGFTLACSLR